MYWFPLSPVKITGEYPGTWLFSMLYRGTSISNTIPSARNDAPARSYVRSVAAFYCNTALRLNSLTKSIWPAQWLHLWSFLLPTFFTVCYAVMLNPLQNKDVATEGFPCYPGSRPGYRRCSVWLPCPSDKASTGICLLRGKQGWHQRDWQLNRLVASTVLLAMPRRLVLCEHGAGEPSWFQVQDPRCLYRGGSFWSPKVSMGRDSCPSPGCY